MLVLKRNVNERIIIGDDIIIQVVWTDMHSCKLGIDAPKNITVHREEVYEQIQREKRGA